MTIDEIRPKPELVRSLIEDCRKRLPYEACGVIFGDREGRRLVANGHAFVRNAAPNPERRFSFAPDDWIAVCYEAQKNQRSIVGLFHSHPIGPENPSRRDERGLVPWESYWIVSFAEPGPKLTVYTRDNEKWIALPVVADSAE